MRELQEELGLRVTAPTLLCTREAQGITFDFLLCESLNEPQPTEHEALAWVKPRELLHYAFCPADTVVAQQLAMSWPPIKRCFWDLDGTLMDTYPVMVDIFMKILPDFGVNMPRDRVLALMKKELRWMLDETAKAFSLDREKLEAAFRAEDARVKPETVKPIPGVPALLEALSNRGIGHDVVTHRDESTIAFLEANDLKHHFGTFITREKGFPRKPRPECLQWLLEHYGLQPEEAVMIGDRPLDTDCGKNAGVVGCLLDEGNRFGIVADICVHSMAELMEILCPPFDVVPFLSPNSTDE